jgi:hypothetical protein
MSFQPYSSGKIKTSPSTGVFDKYLDVYGLRLFALSSFGGMPAPEEEFIKKTAQTVKLMLDPDAAGINKNKQKKAIKFMAKQNTMQRIGVDTFSAYKNPSLNDSPSGWDKVNDKYSATDFTYQLRDEITGELSPVQRNQITQQVEHLHHTFINFLMPGVYKKEFNLKKGTGLLWDAAAEAIENGVYDDSDYLHLKAIKEPDSDVKSVYRTAVMTEYAYALTYAQWGYINKYTEDMSLDPEWSDNYLTNDAIKNANPLGHKLYEKYLSKIISRPSESALESIYQDSNGGVSGYIPDAEKENNNKNANTISMPKKFKKKFVDKITNFIPSSDALMINSDSFGIGESATFKAGKNSKVVKKLAKQDFDFLYDKKKGGLYFNENGSDKGFGDGGIIAILKGGPDLTESNLNFI